MKSTQYFLILILLVLSIASNFAVAQQGTTSQDKVYQIVLKDGSRLIGMIEDEDNDTISLTTLIGIEINIEKNQIEKMKLLSGVVVGGKYRRSDPNYTRLFFAPTARPLKSGQGYFSIYELFLPFVAVGIGDVLTLAGGISIFPGAPQQVFYLAPKVTPIHLKGIDMAAGIMHIGSTGGNSEGMGIIYGLGTFGSTASAFTLGLGWGYAGKETADKPIVMVGGELQVSNSFKLITENWFPPDSEVSLISFGFRMFGDNLAADLGLCNLAGAGMRGFPFFPWVGFVYNFNTT